MQTMKQEIIQSISKEIYRRFPEVTGARPKVRPLANDPSVAQAKSISPTTAYLFTFTSQASVFEDKTITRWVRVVVSEQGKILKISTSR
jgi:hypothetical protein